MLKWNKPYDLGLLKNRNYRPQEACSCVLEAETRRNKAGMNVECQDFGVKLQTSQQKDLERNYDRNETVISTGMHDRTA